VEFDYGNMVLSFHAASSITGWELRIAAENGSFLLNHHGKLLADNREVLVAGGKNDLIDGMKRSANDYIDASRTLKEPVSNAMGGMMQLAINTAASRAVRTGRPAEMNKVYDTA
jgi:hypothetical protein